MNPQRDRAFGRFYARKGAARVLHEAERAPPNRERLAAWRNKYVNVPLEQQITPIHRKKPC